MPTNFGGGDRNIDILLNFLANTEDFDGDIKSAEKKLDEFEKKLKTTGDKGSDSFETVSGAIKQAREELKNLPKDTDKAISKIKEIRAEFAALSGAAARAVNISQQVFAVGAGITGGIFAAANAYVKNAEEATNVTRAWVAETEALKRSGARVGAVFAAEALPTLTKAAQLAEKAARFIERNPEIVRAALNAGLVVASLGAVGVAVARGIKLVADIGYIAATANQLLAAKLMDGAANKQLAAGGMAGKGSLFSKAGLGSAASSAGPAGLFVAGIAAMSAISIVTSNNLDKLYESLNRLGAGGGVISLFIGMLERAGTLGQMLPAIRQFKDGMEDLRPVLERLGVIAKSAGAGAKKGVSGTTNFGGGISADVVSAYTQFREAMADAEKNFQETRLDIINDANKSVVQAYRSHTATIKDIMKDYDKSVADIVKDFSESNAQAERDYQEQRAQVIRDAGIEIQRIEEDLQERLRQMAQDHGQRVEDLALNRDALGLIQEQRRYEQERTEAERQANIEIGRRRADLALRLNDMAVEFQQERAERRAEFEERLQEAAEQRDERLKEEQEQYQAELQQIRQNKAERLRELSQQYREEQLRLREAFIDKIRDLDASLLGEANLKRQYYATMLRDAQAFFEAYRSALPGGSSSISGATGGATISSTTITGSSGRTPSRQMGGYAAGGMNILHPGEFVLSPRATKAAEDAIGGRLTQQSLLMALAGGGSSRNMTLNDYRRFSGEFTPSMRRTVRQDTIEVLSEFTE
jgi:hypothetical protein